MLSFEVDTLDSVEEQFKPLYEEKGGKYRLKVTGIDPADELKEALRKERDDRKAANAKLSDYEKAQAESEAKRLEEKQEYETLYKNTKGAFDKQSQEFEDFRRKLADKDRGELATELANSLTRDVSRADLLKKEALSYIQHTADGVVISGPDGTLTKDQLKSQLAERYPFLVDGNQSSGGGATGSNKGSGAVKKFEEHTGAELSELRKQDPALYERLNSEHKTRTRGY